MMHIFYSYEFTFKKELLESDLKEKINYSINMVIRKRDITNVLLEDIEDAMKVIKPSLLILFSHQLNSMFERIFSASNAEEYSFYGKIPLLTFNKMMDE
jgi:hypothetical protein